MHRAAGIGPRVRANTRKGRHVFGKACRSPLDLPDFKPGVEMQADEPATLKSVFARQQPLEIIRTLSTALVPYKCICLVAELGLADQIGDDPVSIDELAAGSEANADALNRVLGLLASYGIFHRDGRTYAHTPASLLLRSDHPRSMRAYARMRGMPMMSATLLNLEHSVRTGAPAIEAVEPNGVWAYLQGHADEARIFEQAMSARAVADVAAVLGAFDFSRFGTIADIGGGRGRVLQAVLDATPGAQGVLFDLPAVIDALDVQHERLTPHAGDFFVDPLPVADAYVLMDVLHDWDDGACVTILSRIRDAAAPGTSVLVIENVLTDDDADTTRGHTVDVTMLALTGGRERSEAELNKLFSRAGFGNATVTNTDGPVRIVEAKAAMAAGQPGDVALTAERADRLPTASN